MAYIVPTIHQERTQWVGPAGYSRIGTPGQICLIAGKYCSNCRCEISSVLEIPYGTLFPHCGGCDHTHYWVLLLEE